MVSENNNNNNSRPAGLRLLSCCLPRSAGLRRRHKALVLAMTFVAYATFHMGRRPLSVVKNVLHPDCQQEATTTTTESDVVVSTPVGQQQQLPSECSSWPPFDKADAKELLAWVDTAFLASYAIAMLFSGMIAERVNLRHFVSLGCALSGLGLVAAGLARRYNIHSLGYFVGVQLVSGAAQSIGWPVVVTCVSNWFSASERGLVFGLWNSHTNLGNIVGLLLAGAFVQTDWGLSFIVPGVLTLCVGGLLFLWLVPKPSDVGLDDNDNDDHEGNDDNQQDQAATGAVSFVAAAMIPGVLEYSLCLFFSKLVSYTYLYWLPKYIASTSANDSQQSAFQSVWFDVGGVGGGILAGHLSDRCAGFSGLICSAMLLLAMPAMLLYKQFGSQTNLNNMLLQSLVGLLVNGPYCLITTSVSADLGTRLRGGRAVATVSAIVDATGSVGAVVGPFLAGYLSTGASWWPVFLMLVASDGLATLCLARIVLAECKRVLAARRQSTGDDIDVVADVDVVVSAGAASSASKPSPVKQF